MKTLTHCHPHRESYPCISTQLDHEVDIDKNTQDGQVREKRNLFEGGRIVVNHHSVQQDWIKILNDGVAWPGTMKETFLQV